MAPGTRRPLQRSVLRARPPTHASWLPLLASSSPHLRGLSARRAASRAALGFGCGPYPRLGDVQTAPVHPDRLDNPLEREVRHAAGLDDDACVDCAELVEDRFVGGDEQSTEIGDVSPPGA